MLIATVLDARSLFWERRTACEKPRAAQSLVYYSYPAIWPMAMPARTKLDLLEGRGAGGRAQSEMAVARKTKLQNETCRLHRIFVLACKPELREAEKGLAHTLQVSNSSLLEAGTAPN